MGEEQRCSGGIDFTVSRGWRVRAGQALRPNSQVNKGPAVEASRSSWHTEP